MRSIYRGHAIETTLGGEWVWSDTGTPVASEPDRPCGHCGLPNTPEGHDGCLGTLPGVVNACCGHGCEREAYVQMRAGGRVAGGDALRAARHLRGRG